MNFPRALLYNIMSKLQLYLVPIVFIQLIDFQHFTHKCLWIFLSLKRNHIIFIYFDNMYYLPINIQN